jgi:hypothetical protein
VYSITTKISHDEIFFQVIFFVHPPSETTVMVVVLELVPPNPKQN